MIRNLREKFMQEAIQEAKISLDSGDWPIGCVIVIDGEIVARGRNQVYSETNKIFHAEVSAISKIPHILAKEGHKATMYVTYEPCPMCIGAALLNHIDTIVCGPDLDGSGATKIIPYLPSRFQNEKYSLKIESGILRDECAEIFRKGQPSIKKGYH